MILLIDNYDSFTYNIYQYISYLSYEVKVVLNDQLTLDEIEKMGPSHIIISPGPGRPEEAGISLEVIDRFKGKVPILGICLGHQCIGAAFGAEIKVSDQIFHGKTSRIFHDGRGLFSNIEDPLKVVRYHSLIVDRETLDEQIEVSAWTDDGTIMGIRHKYYSLFGVQFHPESYGTASGYQLLSNFLEDTTEESFLKRGLMEVYQGKHLSVGDAERVMEEISRGDASAVQTAGLLTAIALKGETVPELTGFARVMRRNVSAIAKPIGSTVVDLCGTGGDNSGTFNISTAAAFVAAGAGVSVAKHGNRSITSRCGSADLCEAVGIQLNMDTPRIEAALRETGISFLFAPKLHPTMKHVGGVRRELGFRTLFNVLGPLTNPATADAQLIGVFRKDLLEKVAKTMKQLGIKRGMVVHGSDGLDEITLTGPTFVSELKEGWIKNYTIDPEEFGFSLCESSDLKGGDLNVNAEIFLSLLEGNPGSHRDVVVLNAAAAIYLSGIAGSFKEGVSLARQSIDRGAAKAKLSDLIRFTANA